MVSPAGLVGSVRPPLCARDLPAKDAPLLEVLAWLVNVEAEALRAAIQPLWRDGDELIAAENLCALRNTVPLIAAAARKAAPSRAKTHNARAVVDELQSMTPGLKKSEAFNIVAQDLGLQPESIGNAYYKQSRQDAVPLIAAAAREAAPSNAITRDVRAVVDELRSVRRRLSKSEAFKIVAQDRRLKPGTVRNAYYKPSHQVPVITE